MLTKTFYKNLSPLCYYTIIFQYTKAKQNRFRLVFYIQHDYVTALISDGACQSCEPQR